MSEILGNTEVNVAWSPSEMLRQLVGRALDNLTDFVIQQEGEIEYTSRLAEQQPPR